MTDFYTLADQLRAELDALFERWPELHPDNRLGISRIEKPMRAIDIQILMTKLQERINRQSVRWILK